jgi:hypothetical protein
VREVKHAAKKTEGNFDLPFQDGNLQQISENRATAMNTVGTENASYVTRDEQNNFMKRDAEADLFGTGGQFKDMDRTHEDFGDDFI